MSVVAAGLSGGIGFSAAGLLVGAAVGATGVGGGSLMTPVLILFYGISPALAVGTDLLYASLSKSFGVMLYRNHGSVDWRIVGWQAVGSVPAALATLAWLQHQGDAAALDRLIKLTLSVAIMVTATFTLFQGAIAARLRPASRMAQDGPHPGLDVRLQRILTLVAGALIGSVVTVSSVGAGAIGMMLLLLLYPKHPPVKIVGSDLAHAVLIT
ncbi:MAG: TSUP family transporter, partial [Nevskiales bacterium]